MDGWFTRFVEESNRIEGIHETTTAHILAHQTLLSQENVQVGDVINFVQAVQPNAVLRDRPGLNVRVGDHIPPQGHSNMPVWLENVLNSIRYGTKTPWEVHCMYEDLHPFTDGNGRSGRALWAWHMFRIGRERMVHELGFLHSFYYQTLSECRHD